VPECVEQDALSSVRRKTYAGKRHYYYEALQMAIGFTYIVVEEGSEKFLKVGKGKARRHDQLIDDARKRLGNLQSCNVRALRFACLAEVASYEAAAAAERA
jgi:hypothetical protein